MLVIWKVSTSAPFYGDVNPAKFVKLIVYDFLSHFTSYYTAKLGLLETDYVIKMLIVCRLEC